MTALPSSKPTICEEVFDDRSQPSEEEIRDFAKQIGIDPDVEAHLLPLAKDGLMEPLPKHWKPVYHNKLRRFYYFNFKTRHSTWEHPLDSKFRQLVKKSRSESLSSAGEEDSKTSVKEELKSFEETVCDSFDLPECKEEEMAAPSQFRRPTSAHGFRGNELKKDLNPLLLQHDLTASLPWAHPSPTTSSDKLEFGKNDNISPLFKEVAFSKKDSTIALKGDDQIKFDSFSTKKKVSFGGSADFKDNLKSRVGRFTIDRVSRIDIDKQQKRLDQEQSENIITSEKISKAGSLQSEFTVTGGGSIFLKSNQKKSDMDNMNRNQPSGEGLIVAGKVLSDIDEGLLSLHDMKEYFGVNESNSQDSFLHQNKTEDFLDSKSHPTASIPSTRSILRPPQADKPLWDMDPQTMTSSEKTLWKQQELEEEKKSVRFNLDQELNISFRSWDSFDSEKDDEEIEWNSKDESSHSYQKQQNYEHLSKLSEAGPKSSVNDQGRVEEKTPASSSMLLLNSNPSGDKNCNIEGNLPNCVANEASNIRNMEKISNPAILEASDLAHENGGCENESFTPLAVDPQSTGTILHGNVFELFPQQSFPEDKYQFSHESSYDTNKSNVLRNSGPLEINPVLKNCNVRENNDSSLTNVPTTSVKIKQLEDCNQASSDLKISDLKLVTSSFPKALPLQYSDKSKQLIPESKYKDVKDSNLIKENVIEEAMESSQCSIQEISEPSDIDANNHEGVKQFHEDVTKTPKNTDATNQIDHAESNERQAYQMQISSLENRFKDKLERLSEEYMKHVEVKEAEFKLQLENKEKELISKLELDLQKQQELQRRKEKEMKEAALRLESECGARIHQLKEQLEHKQKCAIQELKQMHQQVLASQEVENQATMLRIREQHAINMKTLRDQLLKEEEELRKEHIERILKVDEDMVGKHFKEASEQLRIIEKLRCEKHLLENKYRTLKERYIKLKSEVKMNTGSKNQKSKQDHLSCKGEQQRGASLNVVEHDTSSSQTQSHLTSDRSSKSKEKTTTSTLTSKHVGFQSTVEPQNQGDQHSSLDPSSAQDISHVSPGGNVALHLAQEDSHNIHSARKSTVSIQGSMSCAFKNICNPSQAADQPKEEKNRNFHRDNVLQETSYRDPSFLNSKANQIHQKTDKPSPMEALRHQLRTLDELEEQFPASSSTDAYLRYPFADHGELKSAELEFFRHRIHLERDMIRRAKCSLQAQQGEYQTRLQNFTKRQSSPSLPSSTLYQMSLEEKELSGLEESLQKTQTLLSEKIARLCHLEKSFQNYTSVVFNTSKGVTDSPNKMFDSVKGEPTIKPCFNQRWDWNVAGGYPISQSINDELSSDSGGSSGFSSTEYTPGGKQTSFYDYLDQKLNIKQSGVNSSDINLSISNLNSEISGIWSSLCQRRTEAGLGLSPLVNEKHRHLFNTLQSPSAAQGSNSAVMPTSVTSSLPLQTSGKASLIERSNNLRHWLQKVKLDSALSLPSNH